MLTVIIMRWRLSSTYAARFRSVRQSTWGEPSQLLTVTTEIQLILWRLINEQLLMRRGNPLHRRCNASVRCKLVGRVHRGRKPADTKDVLSIINEVSLSVAKRINRRVPLRAVLHIYYWCREQRWFLLEAVFRCPTVSSVYVLNEFAFLSSAHLRSRQYMIVRNMFV